MSSPSVFPSWRQATAAPPLFFRPRNILKTNRTISDPLTCQLLSKSVTCNAHLHILYAQRRWITLALSVFPRLLAQSCPGLSTLLLLFIVKIQDAAQMDFTTQRHRIHLCRVWLIQTVTSSFQNSTLQPPNGCLDFVSVLMWLAFLPDQL